MFQLLVYNNFKQSKNPKLQKIEVHAITSKFHSLSSKMLPRKNQRLLIDELQLFAWIVTCMCHGQNEGSTQTVKRWYDMYTSETWLISQLNTLKRHKANTRGRERKKNKIWDTKSYKILACIVPCYHSINKGFCIEPLMTNKKVECLFLHQSQSSFNF